MPSFSGLSKNGVVQLLESITTGDGRKLQAAASHISPALLRAAAERLCHLADLLSNEEPAERIQVSDPSQFASVVAASAEKKKTFALFTAALQEDTGEPWCPDARAAEPVIFEALDAPGVPAAVVVCRLPREDWKNTAAPHAYRAAVGLTNLPTLLSWETTAGETGRLVEDECKELQRVVHFIKGNSEKSPRVPALSIAGWVTCPFYQKAKNAVLTVKESGSLDVNVIEFADKPSYKDWLAKEKETQAGLSSSKAQQHGSSPIVWLDDTTFIGGCDDTLAWVSKL